MIPVQTLAATLSMTTPVSPLLRKAKRLGIHGLEDMISLAVARGCTHYARMMPKQHRQDLAHDLSDAELTILLLIGENPYSPAAIRCAGQMARSPHVDVQELARLAVQEKCERVLIHIARAGLLHDPDGHSFWEELTHALPALPEGPEPELPHWSRFMSMPGIQRSGPVAGRWLTPQNHDRKS